MFDKILNLDNTMKLPSKVDVKVEVKEEKAPTDASIQLAIDHEKRARNAVVDSYAFRTNELKGSIVVMAPCYYKMSYEVTAVFELNGKKHKFSYEVDNYRGRETITEAIDRFKMKMAESVMYEIFNDIEIEGQKELFEGIGRGIR